MNVISLTTDFGNRDGFVGIMKGVIASICHHANCIDISHEINQGDITAGAWIIANAYRFFPPGTIHMIVVDPGVGSDRRAIVAEGEEHVFVCPDNGLLTLVLQKQPNWRVYEITNTDLCLPNRSNTFHGRDVFAPVAAHLCAGVKPGKVGPEVDLSSLIRFRQPGLASIGSAVNGTVVYIDRFGNLITNIPADKLGESNSCVLAGFEVPLGKSYSSALNGQAIAYGGSHGYVEIGVNSGRAAEHFRSGIGTAVCLKRS